MFVPVVDKEQNPLMPTKFSRALRWIKTGKATPFKKNGMLCVRLNIEPSNRQTQQIVVGIDPGSKREAFTVKSKSHTYLNVLANSVVDVKDKIAARREARKARRFRNTPCRASRKNRSNGGIPPSTKARWQLKLRIVNRLRGIFPVTDFVVEDIRAMAMGKRKWDNSFSPLEIGKNWFYSELRKIGVLYLLKGYDTKKLRNNYGLEKTHNKMSESFDSHNVDSWVLSNWLVGGHTNPDNMQIKRMIPIRFKRRQLHRFQFSKGGKRNRYGGTMSLGFKKGSVVRHSKCGVCYIGGNMENKLSLHSLIDGRRIHRKAEPKDVCFLTYNSFR